MYVLYFKKNRQTIVFYEENIDFQVFFTNVKRMKKKIANQLLKANFLKLDSYLIQLLLDIPVSRRRRHILELEADSEVTIMILLSTQKTCLRMLE